MTEVFFSLVDKATLRERLYLKFQRAQYIDDCVRYGLSVIGNVRWGAKRRGIPLRQLAHRAGMTERALHLVLAGRTSLSFESIVALARVLEVWPADLLLSEDEFRGLEAFMA